MGGTGITVNRIGDKFTINQSVPSAPVFVQMTDPGALSYNYVWYEIDGDGELVDTHVRVAP